MTAAEILKELEANGSDHTKKILLKHGAREPFYGVPVAYLKKVQKRLKKNHLLSLELYDTGNSDAMYLAGLIADAEKLSKADLQRWAEAAYWYMISDYTVAQTAAASPFGFELARQWIDAEKEFVISAGWATLSNCILRKEITGDELMSLDGCLDRANNQIHHAPNRVRYSMNGFVIAVGSCIPSLSAKAIDVARHMGKVAVDMGGTACKVPFAPDYIEKAIQRGSLKKYRNQAD